MAWERENHRDDDDRTSGLLDHVDAGLTTVDEFAEVLLDGLGTDKAAAAAGHYPPKGHGYPRRTP